jgi:hypothetical protein
MAGICTPWPPRTSDPQQLGTAETINGVDIPRTPHHCPRRQCMDTHTQQDGAINKHNSTTHMTKREGHENSPTRLEP